MRTGTLTNATLILYASVRYDQGCWARHRRDRLAHDNKTQIATDQKATLIDAVEVTIADMLDAVGGGPPT